MVIRKRRDSVYSEMCLLCIDRPRLCFAVNRLYVRMRMREMWRTKNGAKLKARTQK